MLACKVKRQYDLTTTTRRAVIVQSAVERLRDILFSIHKHSVLPKTQSETCNLSLCSTPSQVKGLTERTLAITARRTTILLEF